jgi:hypothetical protein
LVEEAEVPGENHRPATSHRQTLSHNVVSSKPHRDRMVVGFITTYAIGADHR